jgi:serine/threonine protein kinase
MGNKLDILRSEVETIQRLQKLYPKCSKHLLCYKDISEDRDNVYFVSELMKGDLIQLVTSKKFQSESICRKVNIYWNIMGQVIKGLEQLHKAGIIHRDIKLDNILIGQTNSNSPYKKYGAKIADFGLGCLKNVCEGQIGSVQYLQPRVLFQNNFDDWRSGDDLYALGVTLFILFTGRHFTERAFFDKLKSKDVSYKTAVSEYLKMYKSQMMQLDIVKINARKCPAATKKKLDKLIKITKYLTKPEYSKNITVDMIKKMLKK